MRAVMIMVALFLGGCAGDGDKRCNDQNRKAGAVIEADTALPPTTRAIGSDIRQNSEMLAESIGSPETSEPYSAPASAAAREQSKKDRTEAPGWLQAVAMMVTPWVPWAAPVILGAWGVIQSLGRKNAVKKLTAVYDGVDAIKKEVGEGKYSEAITDVMREVAGLRGVYTDIKADLKEFRS